jgi:hypothetical protein
MCNRTTQSPQRKDHEAAPLRSAFIGIVCVLAAASTTTALAHHSPVMFDQTRQITLTGTVREFQWTNPHSYIQLAVKDDQGQDVEWNLEMAAPTYLYNLGWRPSTIKAGDVLTVTIAPLRKGGNGGLLLNAATAGGKPIGRTPGATP